MSELREQYKKETGHNAKIYAGLGSNNLSHDYAVWLELRLSTPKHETVSEWENRTGESYPDDAPVWFRETGSFNEDSFNYWELGTYKTNTPYGKDETVKAWIKWNKGKSIVANHHGKPEE